MSEYDLQFQADLEKAQALSLESLALDQFRRQKQLASGAAGVSAEARDRSASREPPPALPPPPRKPPRLHHTSENRSHGTSPVKEVDADLISFTSPTSKAAPRDPHANFIEQINKLGLQDEVVSSPGDKSPMNNQWRGGVPYPPAYQYAYSPPYPPAYPAGTAYPTPYAMPSPVPYQYYPPPNAMPPDQQPAFPVSPMYPPAYTLTRLASPAPYQGYPPPPAAPQYQYNTTNMISRPLRPPPLYPQLPPPPQAHTYPAGAPPAPPAPAPTPAPTPATNNHVAAPAHPDTARNSVESNSSRKSSEVSIASNESGDVVGSLPLRAPRTDLIDFGRGGGGGGGAGSVRVSVLEAFDPLLTDQPGSSANQSIYAAPSECSSSVYEEYDPLDFLYGETEIREAPVYAAVGQRETAILRSPPPASHAPRAVTNKLYDSVVKVTTKNYDSEHRAFLKMVLDVRKEFVYSDVSTNPGYVVASRSDSRYPAGTSIKLQVHAAGHDEPIAFTSDVESTVDHVILTVVCSLDEEVSDMSGYMLRVWGANEYLQPGSSLSDYDYVRACVRLEKDVRLCLHCSVTRDLARTERDDAMAQHLTLEDLMPIQPPPNFTFDNLSILLETLEGELSRAIGVAGAEGSCPPGAVLQAVKAVVALGGLETLHVTRTLHAFAQACTNTNTGASPLTPEVVSERGDYAAVRLRSSTAREAVAAAAAKLRDAVRSLLALHSRTHISDFRLAEPPYYTQLDPANAVPSNTVHESTLVCIEAVHSVPPCLPHEEHLFLAQVFHGTRPVSRVASTQPCHLDQAGFYPRIIADTWLNLEDVPVSSLPRESRLVLTLVGRSRRAADTPAPRDEPEVEQFEQQELGWAALPMFQYDGMLASGSYMLPLWPRSADKRLGPAPALYDAPPAPHPIINIEIPLYAHNGVRWSSGSGAPPAAAPPPAFDSLDAHTQCQLLHLIEQGPYQKMPTECREIMWEKRQYLVELAGALPLVLLTATAWHGEQRAQLMALVDAWRKPSATNAMHLLLPCFPDADVRAMAVALLAQLDDGCWCRCLPQLLAGARSDWAAASPLAALLLRRALASPKIAATMFWLLVHGLPNHQGAGQEFLGISLDEPGEDAGADSSVVFSWRRQLLLHALLATCGDALAASLQRQQLLVQMLTETAISVKTGKEGARSRALTSGATQLATLLHRAPAALPLSPAATVHDVNVQQCSYFASNTLPLKINFIGRDNAVIPAMFKIGDDLRQDALVLQIIQVMDALWLRAGLDLRLVSFQAVPTSYRRGMIEIVSEAETLRAIQTEWGLTGSFKDKPIAEWLAKHNPSELEYQRARDNFTASCAGYSVATYLLGVCDRHNDNIMLKTSGHLFHIDFGKFLGDAQMFGNFKRDRAPFVLTHDMVYVMNGGERPTQRFQHFVELCASAFNVVRAQSAHLLDLLALMASSGVPGVTSAAVGYVRAALLPAATNAEAAAAFARLIHSSLKSKFTPINFFLHNLAQLRAGDAGGAPAELLSFMPRTYTMAQEGRLETVECLGYEKRYDPEKHYVFSLRVTRRGHATPALLYRSYRHFTELYQKICLHFPLAKVHSLPMGLHVGRSNTRIVAERRFSDVQAFLRSLFGLADEIAHSDLVYTFFHPLLRDQQDLEPQRTKHKGEAVESLDSSGSGSLKMSVQYAGGALSVLILHAQSLALTPQGLPPNPYVKVYLVPDPTKETKRKTRVLKRNSHPSFMEMLEYRLPLEVVKSRSLQATVWHYDSLQENQFLGGAVIPLAALPLRDETVAWYPLQYIPR